ncbi:hypothetical protein CHLRE_05g238850v5 [Chlamydomonas reinhardtii]|uniref:Uncharacterized protein n=1 Tax=Chlamydomonas reinhardtii TaxID=3055 RepID=A0A2K3DT15_CHLRE|nr:uncharacterized protein CHLRE_05g238850v5 [Chlamydomonas reinhardtii]PNW83675.1 hypothetical protein CHLRE_05g238850v5 [Chlamydomonas reinhardtii]
MLASLSRQAGALVRHSALQVESATAAHGSISACITQPLPTGSGLLCCGSSQSCAPSYSTAAVHWQEGACRSSDGGDGNTNSSSGCTSTSGHWAARSASTTHRWRRALGCSAESKVVDWTREEDQPGSGASIAVLVAPFTSLALRMGLGSRGGILAARRLRGEPEPFEDEQDDDEYEDGEYVDLDDEELLGDLDELDEMEIDGEWDEGEWEEDRQAEEELGEGEERPGAGAGAGEGRKGGVAPPLPPSPRPGRDWRS